jgi:hypothetical protein
MMLTPSMHAGVTSKQAPASTDTYNTELSSSTRGTANRSDGVYVPVAATYGECECTVVADSSAEHTLVDAAV